MSSSKFKLRFLHKTSRAPAIAPTITNSSAFSHSEGSLTTISLTSNQTVTWTKVGGADQALFTLTGSTLTLPSETFATPADADANNTYIVTVRATNVASLTADMTITLTITALSGGLTLVGPGASFNGTPLSGGTPPVNPVRSSGIAKPALKWLIPSEMRVVGDLPLGVEADAKGGLVGVTFWVEGTTYLVTTPTIYTDTDASGNTRHRLGYWIALDSAAFKAKTTTGSARIYATATPNDGTMQTRTIGYDLVAAGQWDGNYPMIVYPRNAQYDWDKTLAPSGADFTTLKSALDNYRTTASKSGRLTITTTGSYENTDTTFTIGANLGNYYGGEGPFRLCTAGGVTATIGRATAFDTTQATVPWDWTPGVDFIEFYGSGIVLDHRNWAGIGSTTYKHWANGCKDTNSIGTRDTYYWNGTHHPGFGGYSYIEDATQEYVSGGHQLCRIVRGNKVRDVFGDLFDHTHYIADNYIRGYSSDAFKIAVNGMSLTYVPPAGQTSASLTKTTGDSAGAIQLKVNGSVVHTFNYNVTTDRIDNLVSFINGFADGFTATALNGRGQQRVSLLGNGSTISNLDVFNVTTNIVSGEDIHDDWWQHFASHNTRENVIITRNVTRDATNISGGIFLDIDLGTINAYDYIIKNNVWTDGFGATVFGRAYIIHLVYENNTNGNWVTMSNSSAGDKTYSSFKDNLVCAINNSIYGNDWTTGFPIINCGLGLAGGYSAPSGGSNTGNFVITGLQLGGSTLYNLFRDWANGDFRPAVAGTLASNLKAKANTYDASLTAWSATDVIGAYSVNAPTPSWPF